MDEKQHFHPACIRCDNDAVAGWRITGMGWALFVACVVVVLTAMLSPSPLSAGAAVLLVLFVIAVGVGPSPAISKYGGSSEGRIHLDPKLGERNGPPRV